MKYSQIKLNDIANSEGGINLSIWTQGCPHHCEDCFNPETWEFGVGKDFTQETLSYIFNNINNYGVERNLSILGGEPLCTQNIEGVIHLCKSFKNKFPNKKILLWTGYTLGTLNDTQKRVLPYIDILVDGRFEHSKKDLNLKLRGSYNQKIYYLNM